MTEIRNGIRNILSLGVFYDLFQEIVGANRWRNRFLNSILTQISTSATVVDIGCGTGKVLFSLPETVNYIGIDRNVSYIEIAKRRALEFSGDRKIDFIQCDLAYEVPKITAKVNVILLMGVLHHLTDDECNNVLSFAARILDDDGRVYLLEPVYASGQSRLARYIVSKDRGCSVRNVEGYTNLLAKHFTKIEKVIKQNPIVIPYTGIEICCSK